MITMKTNNITGRVLHSSVFAEDIWRATDADLLVHLNATSLDFGLITDKDFLGKMYPKKVHLNSGVPFASALLRSIRDNPELYHDVAMGIDIKNENDFARAKKNLKNMYEKALASLDHDIVYLDEEDYCTMGILYSILMTISTQDSKDKWASDLAGAEVLEWTGVAWYGDGRPPAGDAGLANFNYYDNVSRNLKGVTISEMDWKPLVFRTVSDLVKMGGKAHFLMEIYSMADMFPTPEDMYTFIETYYAAVSIRNHMFTLVIDKNDDNIEYVNQYCTKIDDDLYSFKVPGSRALKLNLNVGFSKHVMVIF
jgi:hypothetical protein